MREWGFLSTVYGMCRALSLSGFVALALLMFRPVWASGDEDVLAVTAAALKQRIVDQRPRLLLQPGDLPGLRAFVRRGSEGAVLWRAVLPPSEVRMLTPEPVAVRNGTPEGARGWQAGYTAAHEAGSWAQRYALAWQVSGDPAMGREAARWLLHLASWRMTRETYRINDELFIQHLRPMIFAYDWAHGALTPEERAIVRGALHERLSLLAQILKSKLSPFQATSPDNTLSHPVRFVSTLGQGALALLHEVDEAPGWLAWSYEYYLRQFPIWGGEAGGWAEGLNYWSTGMTQHLRFLEGMASLGFDAPLQRPFWRNTAYFGVYGLMPYPAASFGDLANLMPHSGSLRVLMEKLGLQYADPAPMAFARLLDVKPPRHFGYYTYDGIDSVLHAFRMSQAELPPVRLESLPQSRYFDDVGVVTMHSALGDAARDIMLAFRASRQGSASHAFADQNSFVLNAFGQPLAISSGYREYYDSPHHAGWTRQTRAKNAILFGGRGQRVKDASAVGRIVRFANNQRSSPGSAGEAVKV